MITRRLPLIVGIILAIGTALLLFNYTNAGRQATAQTSRTVVVATRDIPARAPIPGDALALVRRPVSDVDTDALAAIDQTRGTVAIITIPAGSVVTQSKIGKLDALALPRRLARGLRAVSISIDRVKGVSGLIEPGDRVDVIAVPPRVGNETPRATTILRGALVLAMGSALEAAHATPAPAPDQNLTTVTLAVTPKQANLLALADVDTTLRLALRPPSESIRAYPAEPLQLGIPPQSAPAPAPAAPAPAPPVAAPVPAVATIGRPVPRPYEGVPVIDGDRLISGSHP